jgi:hypothetical protein
VVASHARRGRVIYRHCCNDPLSPRAMKGHSPATVRMPDGACWPTSVPTCGRSIEAHSWCRVLAISAADLGDHAAAVVWCTDTERRGRDAAYPELFGWAALTRSLITWYQGGHPGHPGQLAEDPRRPPPGAPRVPGSTAPGRRRNLPRRPEGRRHVAALLTPERPRRRGFPHVRSRWKLHFCTNFKR